MRSNEGISLGELKAFGFDTARSGIVSVDGLENPDFQAIVNEQTGKVSTIASKYYKIVQHGEVAGSVADALNGLNIKSTANVLDGHDKVVIDINFTDSKLYVQKGEEFYMGIRIVNSFNRTTGINIMPRLTRLVCSNGMVVSCWIKAFSVKHIGMVEGFQKAAQKIISQMANSNERFKALVNDCIGDSTEWALLDQWMPVFMREKHSKVIMDILNKKGLDTVTRWDLYNAITDYATHGESLSASMNIWMQNKAQKVLTTPLVVLAEAYQPVGGDAE